jgi:hypothetical protein
VVLLYVKLLSRAGIVSVVAVIVQVRMVMGSSAVVSSVPIVTVGTAGLVALAAALFVVWRHNQLVYPRQLAEWEGLFLCQRCGGVSETCKTRRDEVRQLAML